LTIKFEEYETGSSDNHIDLKSELQNAEYIRETVGLERPGEPDEVAKVIGFLASGFSSFVQGANIIVDGGKAFYIRKINQHRSNYHESPVAPDITVVK
jgi:NAD(P)-dependent dehydrogenase (short-subunit alcohol dehydrogenase family)